MELNIGLGFECHLLPSVRCCSFSPSRARHGWSGTDSSSIPAELLLRTTHGEQQRPAFFCADCARRRSSARSPAAWSAWPSAQRVRIGHGRHADTAGGARQGRQGAASTLVAQTGEEGSRWPSRWLQRHRRTSTDEDASCCCCWRRLSLGRVCIYF